MTDVRTDRSRLTLEQKASLTSGGDFWHTTAIDAAGIPAIMVTDGPHGLRKQSGSSDHLGLGDSVPATCFPPAVALGSSWDVDLAERVGEALGAEARAEGVAVLLGPGVNIKRSPLCGRNFEYFAEDPFIAGRMGAALVKGVQRLGVGTSVKHFAANNQETDRMRVDADIDERALREIYLAAFEHIVTTAEPWTVMCSYNRVNGEYASQSRRLLTEILREEWGFDGLVMSDWGAVNDRVAALAAGLDLEMPPSGTDAVIAEAVRTGELAEAVLDLAVDRLLTLLDRTSTADPVPYDVDAHHALAREAARASAVLLDNDGLLPIDPAGEETVAVIGEFARTPRYQGAGSSQVVPTRLDTALEGLRSTLGDRRVRFAAGFRLDGAIDADLLTEAAAAAREADVVLLFLGLPAPAESEGFDRSDITLPFNQLAVLDVVVEANPQVAVVLSNGGVVSVTPWRDKVAAVLEGWLLGQAGGSALADLITGAANPSGKLTETIPLRLEDNPSFLTFPGSESTVRYGEGIFVGYRGYDRRDQEVAYPFGHGLSYTTFDYSELEIRASGDGAVVSFTVTNTGKVAGAEVAQVYVGPADPTDRPVRELKGFVKVDLAPGASARATVELAGRAFARWSVADGRWRTDAGRHGIEVGTSSRDLRLRGEILLPGDGFRRELTDRSSLTEWLADPVGAELLHELLEGSPMAGMTAQPEMLALMGSAPLAKLAAFASPELATRITDLVEQVRQH